MVEVSFGYEYEFFYITSDDRVITEYHYTPNPIARVRGWHWQGDYTAGSELSTPVYTNIVRASRNIDRQFRWWLSRNDGYAPYFYTPRGYSLGQHHHYGLPSRRLQFREKYQIAYVVSRFYPLFNGLYANPVPSHRGLTSRFCYSISQLHGTPISTDHYCEISDSHNGTVELRLFDANIPQLALSVTTFIKPLVEKALEEYENGHRYYRERINTRLYSRERRKALEHGLRRLNLRQYLTLYKDYVGDIRLPNLNSVKEIWYLAVKERLTPYELYKRFIVDNGYPRFRYWSIMVSNTSKFLENYLELIDGEYRERIEEWISESHRITHVSDLIEILGEVEPRRIERVRRVVERVLPRISYPSRRYVRELLSQENGLTYFYINRIYEVEGLSQDEVVRRIVELVNEHGEGFTNKIDERYVVEAPERFYVIWIRHPITDNPVIISTIAIRIRTGEISHFVVHRRYRGLGLGRAILNAIIRIARENNLSQVYLWVKHDNVTMQNLVTRLGFTRVDDNGHSYKYVLNL